VTAILGQYLATIFRTVFWSKLPKLSPVKKIHAYKKRRTITFRAVFLRAYKLNVTNKENKKTIFSCVKKLHTIPTDM